MTGAHAPEGAKIGLGNPVSGRSEHPSASQPRNRLVSLQSPSSGTAWTPTGTSHGPDASTHGRASRCGWPSGLMGMRLLGGIDVFVPVPEPLTGQVDADHPQGLRQIAFDQDRLCEPSGEEPIEDFAGDPGPFGVDRLAVGLVVQSPAGTIVDGRIFRSDAERHVPTTGDFIQDFPLELGTGRRRLLGMYLLETASTSVVGLYTRGLVLLGWGSVGQNSGNNRILGKCQKKVCSRPAV